MSNFREFFKILKKKRVLMRRVFLQLHILCVHLVELFHLFLQKITPCFLFDLGDTFTEPAERPVTYRLLFQLGRVQRILVTDIEADGCYQFLIAQAMFFLEHQGANNEVNRCIGAREFLVAIKDGKAVFVNCGKHNIRKFLTLGIP